ncbi:unnamed protein product [Cochlearia groenlandica]
MEDSKDLDKAYCLAMPCTPVKKPSQTLKVYVRRIKDAKKDQLQVPQVDIQQKEEENNSKETLQDCYDKFEIPKLFFLISVVKDDSQFASENGTKKKSKIPKKMRYNRPRILEEGREPRNIATTRLRTISKKRKKKETNKEEEVIADPGTPEKQSLPKKRKRETTTKNVARALVFEQETRGLSCLELSRLSGPNFPKGRKRMATRRRSVWKKKSRRSLRKKNGVRWAEIAASSNKLEETLSLEAKHVNVNGNALSLSKNVSKQTQVKLKRSVNCVIPKQKNSRANDISKHLVHHMNYKQYHSLASLADVPLHMEDTLMSLTSYILPEQSIKKTKGISLLIKEMKRLKIKEGVTTLNKSSKKKKDMELVAAKVDLDPDTIKEWELLMVDDDLSSRSYDDKDTEFKWKREREVSNARVDLFISRMHLLQGDRKFKQWKGSVVDSVIGVFLTQNVSDHLSSNAFISVAGRFPVNTSESLENHIEEPLEVNDLVTNEESLEETIAYEKTAKRKNEKTGIVEDEQVDWQSIRKMHKREGSRDQMYTDAVDWNAVRLSGEQVFATIIRKRGQFRILSGRVSKFLNDEAKLNGTVDLEWLRDAPSDLVKRYLLEIEGIGLKSAECVRLLGLKHLAFPVDTNVGRIAIRLGWVPLEPLPNGVQMHQLRQYPSMDLIQKYLWPRLCKLPQDTLYELHYQMITFGKVFCTKVVPNCNACPMKSECKYFASAYVSSKTLLKGPEEKTQDTNMTPNTILVEECDSSYCNDNNLSCEPMVEFPSSPISEVYELTDIEDTVCRSPRNSLSKIPEIDIDMDALKKNLGEALFRCGKLLNSTCDDEVSKTLVVLNPEDACIPIKLPRKMKYYNRLRTEHVVYVVPDNHELLRGFETREHDDPSPYLLAIWQPGETSYTFNPPKKKCDLDGSNLCNIKTCSYCWAIREKSSNTFRGTILIPCRTAMRGSFPLNGTYFQTNEVFADHETSLKPIVFPREWCDGLEKRALYCGSSVSSIFRFLDTRRIQLIFWIGFLCMRAFDRKQRTPQELVRRLHTQPDKRGKKHMRDFDE